MSVPDVAFVVPYLAGRYGGPPVVALNLGRTLRRLGGRVSWWATAAQEEQQELASLEAEVRLFPRRFPRRWYYSRELASALHRRGGDFDLLHLHQFWDFPVYAGARVGARLAKPFVVTPHGVFSHRWGATAFKKTVYLATLGKYILRRCSCLHATSASEVEAFRKAGYRGAVTLVPHGIDPQEFAALPEAAVAEELWPRLGGRRVVLFVGRVHRVKGLDQLVAAWKDVRQSRHELLLVVAGPDDGGHRAVIEGLIARDGVQDSVLFTGMVTGRKKLALLSRADLFVLPSYAEGFSMAVLEAMASGLPCVLTTGCNFPEAERAGAALTVEPRASDLAEAMGKILDLPAADRRAMGERGRRFVFEHYTWDTAARKMVTVYNCILKGGEVPLCPEPAALETMSQRAPVDR